MGEPETETAADCELISRAAFRRSQERPTLPMVYRLSSTRSWQAACQFLGPLCILSAFRQFSLLGAHRALPRETQGTVERMKFSDARRICFASVLAAGLFLFGFFLSAPRRLGAVKTIHSDRPVGRVRRVAALPRSSSLGTRPSHFAMLE